MQEGTDKLERREVKYEYSEGLSRRDKDKA
jgi:hypothetical protein